MSRWPLITSKLTRFFASQTLFLGIIGVDFIARDQSPDIGDAIQFWRAWSTSFHYLPLRSLSRKRRSRRSSACRDAYALSKSVFEDFVTIRPLSSQFKVTELDDERKSIRRPKFQQILQPPIRAGPFFSSETEEQHLGWINICVERRAKKRCLCTLSWKEEEPRRTYCRWPLLYALCVQKRKTSQMRLRPVLLSLWMKNVQQDWKDATRNVTSLLHPQCTV